MKRYYISLLHDSFELDSTFETDSPRTALNKWFAYSLKRPTMANISCGTKEDCLALYQEFLRHEEEYYKKYWVERRFCYKFDYISGGCREYLNGRNLYFSGSKMFYDSVPIFCYG